MIFTDRFVYVHEPKTGGTSVTSALLRLHGVEWSRWFHFQTTLRVEVTRSTSHGTFVYHNLKHGTCSEIPDAHRQKPVLATIRSPYDLYVSEYEFGWWKRREFLKYFCAVPGFRERYPRFPDISFAEFVALSNAAFCISAPERDGSEPRLGMWTERFIKYYFRNPRDIIAKLDDDYVSAGQFRADMFDVRFVRTSRLNEELHDFLVRVGYPPEEVAFLRGDHKVLPQGKGRTAEQKWERYYTPELKQEVRRRERHLLAMRPEFDV
ncbi:MAG: hypothetical protein WKG32_19190 [Gemmatimonadaceae bacterium]